MSHRISTFKRLTYPSKEVERGLLPESGLPQTKDLNSIESEVVNKLGNIIGCLKNLEENVLKTSREFLKKTTIEGRENDKIMAVRGNIIPNKKKYCKNLEEDIETLSKVFQAQLKTINKEILSLQALSQGKADVCSGSSGESLNYLENLNTLPDVCAYSTPKNLISKNKELPTIKNIKLSEAKTVVTNAPKFSIPVTLKVNSSPNKEVPRKFTFRTLETTGLRSSEFKKVSGGTSPNKFPVYRHVSDNNLPVNTLLLEGDNISPTSTNIKENHLQNRTALVLDDENLSDSNRDETVDETFHIRERPSSLSFIEDKGSSFDIQCQF